MMSKAIPLLSIETAGTCTFLRLSFGVDNHYDLTIRLDKSGDTVIDDSESPDGTLRPGAHFILGGLDEDDRPGKTEATIFRHLNEDELRWIARTCDEAAKRMRRIENGRRKRRGSSRC